MSDLRTALTFDDVLLIPQKSEVLPSEISLKTHLTADIQLNVPITSAAMDTVTESPMAIAIAREGGLGFIHKNMSIEAQAAEVDRVKRYESGMITNPITLTTESTLRDCHALLKQYKISGLPIVDKNNLLVGIITNRDIKYLEPDDTKVTEVMTCKNLITARIGTSLEEAKHVLWEHRIEKLPIVDKDNHLVGLITSKDIDNVVNYPNACKDSRGRLRCGAAVGIGKDMLDRVDALVASGVDVIGVDSAHGHSRNVIEAVKAIRQAYPTLNIVAGNIVTKEAAEDLTKAGANCVKVGIGPGSICTTRVVAGIGVPQLTAVMEVAKALEGTGIPIIADGGIRYTGDIVKALAAGASSIMAGSLFAGVDESPGDTIIFEGRKFKTYRGMGSLEAMQQGSKDRYFQDNVEDVKKLVPEGIAGRVPYKGTLSEVVYQMVGGLRSGMGYTGSRTIDDLKKAKFIRITNSGILESHPHDVTITQEAPNYSKRS